MGADNENGLNADAELPDGLNENRFTSEWVAISDDHSGDVFEIIEDYCMNKTMDEALEAPLLTREEAWIWLGYAK